MESWSSRVGGGFAHKKHHVSCFSRWGCTWLAGVPVTFAFTVRRHLRETGTQSASPQTPCLVKENSSPALLAVIFNWEKSKGDCNSPCIFYLSLLCCHVFILPSAICPWKRVGWMDVIKSWVDMCRLHGLEMVDSLLFLNYFRRIPLTVKLSRTWALPETSSSLPQALSSPSRLICHWGLLALSWKCLLYLVGSSLPCLLVLWGALVQSTPRPLPRIQNHMDNGWNRSCCCCSVAKSRPALRPRALQHARLLCPPLSPFLSVSCPLSQWCYLTICFSATPFSSCPQSFPASGSFPMSFLFASGG